MFVPLKMISEIMSAKCMVHDTHPVMALPWPIMPAASYDFIPLFAGDLHHILCLSFIFLWLLGLLPLLVCLHGLFTTSSLSGSPFISIPPIKGKHVEKCLLTHSLEVPHHPLILCEGLRLCRRGQSSESGCTKLPLDHSAVKLCMLKSQINQPAFEL